jgi:hypothetical protein
MADKKNIVIKVKYPSPGKMPDDDVSPPKTITEWNIKRIVIALVGVALAFTTLFFLNPRKTKVTDLDKPVAASPEIKADSSPNPKTEVNNHVLRALLTYKVINNEPVDEITLPLKLSKKGSTWIYYFVELKDMKGKTVYHEWLLDGELISRKKVNIADQIWRTSSRQVFHVTGNHNWTVRLVDEAGEILNEKYFNVLYE